jgi:hypothetical protein
LWSWSQKSLPLYSLKMLDANVSLKNSFHLLAQRCIPYIEKMRKKYKSLVGDPERRENLGDLALDENIN